VAVAGVSFAVLMIFLQLGFYGSVENTAHRVFDRLAFDLVIVPPHYRYIGQPDKFPRERVYQVKALPEVERVIPIYTESTKWKNVDTGAKRNIMVLGFNPLEYPFRESEIRENLSTLQKPDLLLIDNLSLPILGSTEAGRHTEIENRRVTIGGHFNWGIGFSADGIIIISDQNYLRLFPDNSLEEVSLGLITLKPGASREAVRKNLKNILSPQARVLTRQEVGDMDFDFWLNTTNTGPMFGAGVIIAFMVGMVVLYQILSTEILGNLKEYATLKAMGYENVFFTKVVLQHGTLIAILGFIPAYGLSFLLYHVTRVATNLPIYMTPLRTISVLVLSIVMCTLSAYLTAGKVKMADPGELF